MARVLNRPTSPYNRQTIADHFYQAFFVDRQPRCVDPTTGMCSYSVGDGCAVGCMITAEDSRSLSGDVRTLFDLDFNIIQHYFLKEDKDFLLALQSIHDKPTGILATRGPDTSTAVMTKEQFERFISVCLCLDLSYRHYEWIETTQGTSN